MSNWVGYEAPAAPRPTTSTAPRLVVEVATKKQGNGRWDHSDPEWRRVPEVTVEDITLETGPEPSSCTILVPRTIDFKNRTENTAAHVPPVPVGSNYEEDPPFVLDEFDELFPVYGLVRIVEEDLSVTGRRAGRWGGASSDAALADEYTTELPSDDAGATDRPPAQVLFVGNVLNLSWDIGKERVRVSCADFRWRMAKMHCYGIAYSYGTGAGLTAQFIRACLPAYNADGLPDMFNYKRADKTVDKWLRVHGPGGLNTDDGETARDAALSYCAWWAPGDVLDSLRRLFSDAAGYGTTKGLLSYDGPNAADKFLEWPEIRTGGLFDLAVPGGSPAGTLRMGAREFALGGMDLASAVALVIARAGQSESGKWGGWDWMLEPVDGEAALARLVVRNLGDPVSVDAGDGDLILPEPGESVDALPSRDIIDGDVTIDGGPYRNRIAAFGGKILVQSSFSTVDGTLAPAWESDEATEFLAAYAADPKTADDKAFPRAFIEWELPRTLNYATATFSGGLAPGSAGIGAGQFLVGNTRKLLGRLLEVLRENENQKDTPIRKNIFVWRSLDGGTNWERLPAGIHVVPRPDVPAIRFSPGLRIQDRVLNDGTVLPWTYDAYAGTPYDLLVTVAVEADDRLFELDDAASSEYPQEQIHVADKAYGIEAVTKSRTISQTDYTGGVPADEIKGAVSPDYASRDDTDRLRAVVRRRAAQLGQRPSAGTLVLSGFHRRFRPGDVIRRIKTSLGDRGTRGPYYLGAGIRSVEWKFGTTQTTALGLHSLPR